MKWYVYTERSTGAYRLPLLGPFDSPIAAMAMVPIVTAAVRDGRTGRKDVPIDAPVRAGMLPSKRGGVLDLSIAVDDEWIQQCIT